MYNERFFQSIIVLCQLTLAYLKCISVVFTVVTVDWCSSYFCIRPLMGPMNSSVARLGIPSPNTVDLVNKARFMSSFPSMYFFFFFLHVFGTLYALLDFPIALVIIHWWYCLIHSQLTIFILKYILNKVTSGIRHNFFLINHILQIQTFNRLTGILLIDCIMGNLLKWSMTHRKIVFIFNLQYICSDNFPQPSWHLIWYYLLYVFHHFTFKAYGTTFNYIFYTVTHVGPVFKFSYQLSCFLNAIMVDVELIRYLLL